MSAAAPSSPAAAEGPVEPLVAPRSAAETAICRLLCVPATSTRVPERDVQRMFGTGIVLSALRCLLTYVVLPLLGPVLGLTGGVGPAIGLPLAVVALVFDVIGVRRFWVANHRSRWSATAVYAGVMALVVALMVIDVVQLIR